ncbi:MAG TPA: hypothetical protein V6D46_03630, partial [Coleofasciculaceae cyanobacterium]
LASTFARFNSHREVRLRAIGNRLTFTHQLGYNCCTTLKIHHTIDRSTHPPTIAIVEREISESGGACRCECSYDVQGTIGPLSAGVYRVKIHAELSFGPSLVLTDQSIAVAEAAEPPSAPQANPIPPAVN